jgi:hypothetical protein
LSTSNDYCSISTVSNISINCIHFKSIYKNSYKNFCNLYNKKNKFNFFSNKVNFYQNDSDTYYTYKNSFFHFKDNNFNFFYKSTISLEYNIYLRIKEEDNEDGSTININFNDFIVVYFNDFIFKKYEIKYKKNIKKILKIENNSKQLKNFILNESFRNLHFNSFIIYNNFILNFLLKNGDNLKNFNLNYSKVYSLLDLNFFKNKDNVVDITSLIKLDNVKIAQNFDITNLLNFIKVLLNNCKIRFFKKEEVLLLDYNELFLLPNFFYKKDFLILNLDVINDQSTFSENFLSKVNSINPFFKFFYKRNFNIKSDSLQNFNFYFLKKIKVYYH